jgi:hypothetical protein
MLFTVQHHPLIFSLVRALLSETDTSDTAQVPMYAVDGLPLELP